MQRKLLILCFLFVLFGSVHAQYHPDYLGDGYSNLTIKMADDYEGEVVCTLIRKEPLPACQQAVLYIHGYNDYFFQKQLGDSIEAHGLNFYALDLRKYGRSLQPHQSYFFCKKLDEYFADIDTAIAIIRQEGNERILLMGHSTGGLISSYYLMHRKGQHVADGLILNSPFLDWNLGWVMEKIIMPVISFLGKLFPNWVIMGEEPEGKSCYAQSLLSDEKGEWEYNTSWKRGSTLKKAGWFYAIHSAQRTLQKGAEIECPILTLSSDQSYPEGETWDDVYLKSDIVLDVKDIQQLSLRLGEQVERDTIAGGIHDLILSPRPARDEAYRKIFDWINRIPYLCSKLN